MKVRVDKASDNNLIAVLTNKTNTRTYTADMSALIAFGFPFAIKLKKASEAFSRTRAYPTHSLAHQVTKWGACISSLGLDINEYDLESPEDLDDLHLIFLEWYFSSGPSAHKIKFSCLTRNWADLGNFIRYCQRTNVLPMWDWYKLPRRNSHPQSENYGSTEPGTLVGIKNIEVDHSYFFKKIVTSRSLAITTTEYLQQLSYELKNNINRIVECCYYEIDKIRSDYDEGELLASKADVAILKNLSIGSPSNLFRVKVDSSSRKVNLFANNHPNGLNNSIWWIKNRHNGYFTRDKSGRYSKDLKPIVKDQGKWLQKYLGLITYRKLVPFITLVVCFCPEINNVGPVLNIKFHDHNEAGNNLFRIVTNKARARSVKSDLLDKKLNSAIIFLKDRTQVYRNNENIDSEIVDYLFIAQTSEAYAGKPRNLTCTSQAGKLFRSFLKDNQRLQDISHTTYSMIRHTLATIEYIDNGGEWYKVALKIGNSINTSMRHYIPSEIKILLREHKVRQHQNEILLVAAYNKNFNILEAVDLSSHEEVELFLSKIMDIDKGRTDILLEILERKISGTDEKPVNTNKGPMDTAYIPISELGLAALFRYEECITSKFCNDTSPLMIKNSITGIAPFFWAEFSSNIRKLLGSTRYSCIEHRVIYEKSLLKLETLRNTMEFEI